MPPKRRWKLWIEDIIDAIDAILEYTKGMDFHQFAADRRTVDAVIRNFAIIGEAANRVPAEVMTAHPEIPWRDMCDMRNIVVHEYFKVSDQIVWETVRADLSPLTPLLHNLLDIEEM